MDNDKKRAETGKEEEEEDLLSCYNCKLKIARQNYVVHTAHCSRHIEVCKKCGEPVAKEKLPDHEASEHAIEDCPNCGKSLEKSALDRHVKIDCDKRMISCVYCDLDLPFNDMTVHSDYCGTRTEKCKDCGEYVMIKYKELHTDSNHKFLKLDDEPGPGASWEVEKKVAGKLLEKLNISDNNDETLLPCEFCDGMFTTKELRRHQVSCAHGWTTTIPILRRLSTVECKICKKSLASKDYEAHLTLCDGLENRAAVVEKLVKNKDDEMPCILCKKSINFDEYDRHYIRCLKNVKQSSSSSSSFSSPTSSSSSSSSYQRRKEKLTSSNVFCAICDEFVNSQDYTRHRVNCMAKKTKDINYLKLPCEFCYRSFSPDILDAHQISCSTMRTTTMTTMRTTTTVGQRGNLIPCEICGELKSISEFNEHQINCRLTNFY